MDLYARLESRASSGKLQRLEPKRYLALGKQKMTLELDKRDERWKLKGVSGLVNTMKTVAEGK